MLNVEFYNLNNNDDPHEIIFQSLTVSSIGSKTIEVLFDGLRYKTAVEYSEVAHSEYFKHCGKIYGIKYISYRWIF